MKDLPEHPIRAGSESEDLTDASDIWLGVAEAMAQLPPKGIAAFEADYQQEAHLDTYAEFTLACDEAFATELPPGKLSSPMGLRGAAGRLSKRLAELAKRYFDDFVERVDGFSEKTGFNPKVKTMWRNAVVQESTRQLWREIEEVWKTWLDHIRKMSDGTVFGVRILPIDDPEYQIFIAHVV